MFPIKTKARRSKKCHESIKATATCSGRRRNVWINRWYSARELNLREGEGDCTPTSRGICQGCEQKMKKASREWFYNIKTGSNILSVKLMVATASVLPRWDWAFFFKKKMPTRTYGTTDNNEMPMKDHLTLKVERSFVVRESTSLQEVRGAKEPPTLRGGPTGKPGWLVSSLLSGSMRSLVLQ